MSSPAAGPEDPQVISVVPILRMYDVAATIRFYIDYLGCSLDYQDGAGDRPVYLQVSRDGMQLHLSSHHDDGTPGTAVLVAVRNISALHAELHQRGYPQIWRIGTAPGSPPLVRLPAIDGGSQVLLATGRSGLPCGGGVGVSSPSLGQTRKTIGGPHRTLRH